MVRTMVSGLTFSPGARGTLAQVVTHHSSLVPGWMLRQSDGWMGSPYPSFWGAGCCGSGAASCWYPGSRRAPPST